MQIVIVILFLLLCLILVPRFSYILPTIKNKGLTYTQLFLLGLFVMIKYGNILVFFNYFNQISLSLFITICTLISLYSLRSELPIYKEAIQKYKNNLISFKGRPFNINLETVFLLSSIAITVYILAASLTPPRHSDSLRYHLEYAKRIVNSSSASFIRHNQLGMGTDAELLFAMIIALISDYCIKPFLFLLYLISLKDINTLQFNLTGRTNKLLSFLFLATPIIFIPVTIVKPDIIQLSFFIAALAIITKRNPSKFEIILSSLFFAEVVALKWTGIVAIASIVFFLSTLVFIRKDKKEILKYLLLLAASGTLVPIFWYMRNFSASHNPIWPVLSSLFMSKDNSLFYYVSTRPSSRTALIEQLGFIKYLFHTFFIYKPSLLGGIGLSSFLLAPVGYFNTKIKNKTNFIIFLTIYILLWYFSKASFRHLIWLSPVLLILGAEGLKSLLQRPTLKYAAAVLILFQVAFLTAYSLQALKVSVGIESVDEYLSKTSHYNIFKKVEKIVPKDDSILFLSHLSDTYYLERKHIDINILKSAIIEFKDMTLEDLIEELKQRNTKYLLANPELLNKTEYKIFKKLANLSETKFSFHNIVYRNRLTGKKEKYEMVLFKLPDSSSAL